MIWISERLSLSCFPRKLVTFPFLSFAYRRRRITPKWNSILWLLALFVIISTWPSEWMEESDSVNKKLIEKEKKTCVYLKILNFCSVKY